MPSVRQWTGREATILRTVMRMSIRAFAEHLGVSASMVTQWKQRGTALVPVPATQGILDTALRQCSEEERHAFFALLTSAESSVEASCVTDVADHQPELPPGMVRQELPSEVAHSQGRWREVRRYLNAHRQQLSWSAAELYEPGQRMASTPLLTTPEWVPPEPVPLDRIRLVWADETPDVLVDGSESATLPIRPLRTATSRFDRYTQAIRYIDRPSLFENRPSYRLTGAEWSDGGGQMTFGLGAYFDKLDVCEAIGHEFASASLERHGDSGPVRRLWGRLPLRRMVDDPFDPTVRAVMPAITTLLIRRRRDGTATFLLHWRDPAKVATAGGLYDTIPAGEFQPGSVLSAQSPSELDLWRNIVRELNEELLGAPEFDGSSSQPLSDGQWPLFRALERARAQGRVKVVCFGIGVDALTLAATIPSALVIDDEVFDQLFGEIAESNAEGITVTHWNGQDTTDGIPFTQRNVVQFLEHEPMAPPGAACLALAWRHREVLLAR